MSCCGGKRASTTSAFAPRTVTFEYQGRGAMTLVGAATRKIYWFSGPGARIEVHARDAESLATVPNLLRVAR